MKTDRPTLPDGNDLYREIVFPDTGVFPVTYWHLWMVLLLTTQFAGDWEPMLAHFRQETKAISWHRDQAEGVVNHLLLLHQSLEQAGLAPGDLLQDAEPDFLKKQKAKAKRKLLKFSFREHEKSRWMIETPRWQRESRAMRGYWEHFPVSPLIFTSDLADIFLTGRYHLEEESFKLERKLSNFLKKKESRLDLPGQLALYRAFLTVVIENMNGVDDSYGVVGDIYENVFEDYYQLDRTEISLPPQIFFQDLLELMIWEDYAFTNDSRPGFFASLSLAEIPLVEAVLRRQWQELGELGLEYQSQEALTMLGLLYAQQAMFDRFIPIAKNMGTSAWQRITLLAGVAEKHGEYELACGVYEACLGPGRHEKYLRDEYEKLKHRIESMWKKK